MNKNALKDRIVVGAIAGSFGVKGEVRLKSFCANPADIGSYGPLLGDNGTEYGIKITRQVKSGFAARLSGVRFKDEADALRGVKLYAARDLLPALPNDEFYHADLIGLEVLDTGGVLLGKVSAVLNHGAGDLLELRGPGIKGTALLPFTVDGVPTIDLTARRIIADPPEGLFTEEKPSDKPEE